VLRILLAPHCRDHDAADGGDGVFDIARYISEACTIEELRATQRVAGSGGTTAVEFIRLRSGSFASLGIASISTTAGFDTTTATIADTALQAGDFVICRLRSVQNTTPGDLTLQMKVTAV
jgi:hypothetical protein